MLNFKDLSEKGIKKILNHIEAHSVTNCSLPGSGFLHIENDLPYLILYRWREDDPGTERLVISQSSYMIIGSEDFSGYQELLFALSSQLSSKFELYLLFEMFTGNRDSNTFRIKGPAERLPTTMETLKNELEKMREIHPGVDRNVEIIKARKRQREGDRALMTIERAKNCGAVLVGLEIPPIYRSEKEQIYPVFFRTFRDFIIRSVHLAIYNFLRVQTTSGISSYMTLGRHYLENKIMEIDKKLTDIEQSYQFLWLVSPSNIQQIKERFFESGFEEVLNYHYRLLPVDPDVLKRALYNLPMEEIEDPAISYIFREKREELDQQITMLGERGSRNFFYNSLRLYQGVDENVYKEAKNLLAEIEEVEYNYEGQLIDSLEFSSMARREFDYFREQDPEFKSQVHIRPDVNVMMVSQGELYIPRDYKLNAAEAHALIQHEVGTHVLTYHNGSQQPLRQMSIGLAHYDPLQEGLAVLAEYFTGGLTANRLRTLAGRVIAGKALIEGADFQEIFRLLTLKYGFSAERSFNVTSRIMQGGGFLKDIIYLEGLISLRDHLKNGGEYENLLAGKFGLRHFGVIKELTERKILKKGRLRPRYIMNSDFEMKIKLIREGIPLSQMIK